MITTWPCGKCLTANQPEDRYCGECGSPRNATVVAPIIPAPSSSSALLTDFQEPSAGSFEGAPLVLAVALISAAALGALYHGVARAFDLMILFPIFLGVAVGWALRLAALKGRCRRVPFVLAVALLAGASSYGFRQTLDTLRIQGDMRRFLAEKAAEEALPGEKPEVVRLGFADTLRLRAATGIGFGSERRASRKPLRGAGFYLFLLFETALVAGVAATAVHPMSRLAACSRCRRFVPSVPVFRVNGRDASQLADAIRRQQWKQAQEMSDRASATPSDRAEASLLRCAGCDGSSIRVDLVQGKRSRKVMHVALPPESLEALARTA